MAVSRTGKAGRVAEEIIGIKAGPLAEPPSAAVKLIAALFHKYVEYGAAVISEFRRKAVIFELELLNYFYGRLIIHVRIAAFALFRSGGERPVQPHFGGGIALPIGNEIGS